MQMFLLTGAPKALKIDVTTILFEDVTLLFLVLFRKFPFFFFKHTYNKFLYQCVPQV